MSKVIKGGPPMPQVGARPSPIAPSVAQAKLGPPKSAPIIQRELVDANKEAKRILQAAMEEAERIKAEAERMAEEARQQGYEEGHQEGLASYTEQTTQAILQLNKRGESIEAEFVKLVRVCVERVLGQELKMNPTAVVGVVRAALQDARQQREIIVRIHPEDAESLRANQRRMLEVLARANAIEIREDPSVSRGGCVVVTELGMIDASIERQLGAIESAVEEEYRESIAGVSPAASTAYEAAEDYEQDEFQGDGQ